MHHLLPRLVVLLALLAAGSLLAQRLRAPAPALLALIGVLAAMTPGMPEIELDPELILVAFLPPLLYADAFQTSWIDFKRWLRPIAMLAIGLVLATIVTVGLTAHEMLPHLSVASCLLLGAVLSPTDTVAVQAVIERLHVPRRITAILGGESLVNDATGLVGVQVGIAVVLHGSFDPAVAGLSFARVAGLGVLSGLVIGLVFARLNLWFHEVRTLFTLSLLSPYVAYAAAEMLGGSGVLAVVVAGFVVAWRIHSLDGDTRFELYSSWDKLTFLLNGLCFLLVGFSAPLVLEARPEWLVAGLVITLVVVVTRIGWCVPGAYLPLVFSPRLRKREGGYPPAKGVVVVSWAGVRGVVSLAAALALPMNLPDGTPFPGRAEIVACTLVVVLTTLLVQGLTLQPLIEWLGIRGEEDSVTEIRSAREALLSAGIARLDAYCSETSCPLSVHHWRELMADELRTLEDKDEATRKAARSRLDVTQDVRREVVESQRRALLNLRDGGRINDRTYMGLLLELDRAHLATASSPA
ncbi:MAG: Na+/H+ antiporter [Planctomycetota bacterium]|nr:Na+/H+ antiporter [Planctomycetota bacterium]